MWLVRAAVLGGLVATMCAPAAADEPSSAEKSEARRLYGKGKVEFKQARLAAALDYFERAYRLWPQPVMLFNIAQTQRLLGDCRAARHAYKKYLVEIPDAANRDLVEKWLAEMEQCIAEQERAEAERRERERLEAEAAAARAEASKPYTVRVRNPVGMWLMAGGGAVLATGSVFTGVWLDRRGRLDDVESQCTGGALPLNEDELAACARDERDSESRWRTTAALTLGAGAAVALTGLAIWLWGKDERRYPSAPSVGVSSERVTLEWTF